MIRAKDHVGVDVVAAVARGRGRRSKAQRGMSELHRGRARARARRRGSGEAGWTVECQMGSMFTGHLTITGRPCDSGDASVDWGKENLRHCSGCWAGCATGAKKYKNI